MQLKKTIEQQINKEPKILIRKYKIIKSNKSNLKIVVSGHYFSGKTGIIHHFIRGLFPDISYGTAIPICHTIKYKNIVNIDIWDTSGSEEWLSMNSSSLNGADAILWVCSYDYENA